MHFIHGYIVVVVHSINIRSQNITDNRFVLFQLGILYVPFKATGIPDWNSWVTGSMLDYLHCYRRHHMVIGQLKRVINTDINALRRSGISM